MRRTKALAVAAALAMGALAEAGCGREPEAARDLAVFDGARLILGDGRVVENGRLVVQDGRIVQAGPADGVEAPAGAQRVDLAGKTVMPALIDTHVHLSTTPDALTEDLRARARWGVGAAMSLGSDPFDILAMRARQVPGAARYFSAGRGITRPEPGRGEVPYWINTEDEARQAVRELAEQQVDIVKIWVDDRGGMYEKLTPALYGAIIDEAHRHGLRVTAHIFTLEDAKGLLRAGVDAFAHSVRETDVDDEFMALLAERPEVVVNPNLPGRGVRTDLAWLQGELAPEALARLEADNTDRPEAQAAHAIQARNLARLSQAGVTIVLGTDGNNAWAPHAEMEDMVLAGMSPMDVIVASTRNAADFLRIQDMGTLEPGKSADFVVLDANPLDDIRNTRRISAVYLRGEAVDRSQP